MADPVEHGVDGVGLRYPRHQYKRVPYKYVLVHYLVVTTRMQLPGTSINSMQHDARTNADELVQYMYL